MSSTNKTTYYELPQFVDNDIFNPLVDDNDAYSKIDTALHNIANAEADDASEIVNIKSRLDSAEGDIDALEAQNGNNVLTTTAQTLSGAVNELDADNNSLDGRLDVVEDDINNVSTGLKAKVDALETAMSTAEGDIDNLEAQCGNETLTTTAQTLSGAVNELEITKSNGQSISQFTKTIKNETSYINALTGDIAFNNLQGVSYDTLRNRYCFVILKDDNECMLVNTASDMETVITRKVHTDLGHGNPFAYNPNTDRFVFAPSYSTKQVLVEVNASTLETIAEHDFGGTSIALNDRYCAVTYDVEKNVYYICTPNKLCTISSTFVEISRVNCNYTGMIKNLPSSASYWVNLVTNGVCYYNGKIFSIVTFNDGTYHHWIVATNLDGTPFATWKLSVDNGYNEVEAIIVVNDELHAFTRGTLFEDIVLTLQEYGDYSEFKWYECGVAIPDYADLNDYLVSGNYYTSTKANAETVSHTAFVMSNYQLIVRQIVGYIEQIAISVISDRFIIRTRRYNVSEHAWGNWVDLRTSTNSIYPKTRKSLNGVMCGHVTAGGTHCCVQLPSIDIYTDSNYTIAEGLTLEGKIIVRTIDGYYEYNNSHELDINNDLASYGVAGNGVGLYFDFVLPTAISHNNTPIVVELSNAFLNYYNS